MARQYKRISPIDLSDAVNSLLKEYSQECFSALADGVLVVSNNARKKLSAVSRFAPDRTPTGAYSADWTSEAYFTSGVRVHGTVFNFDHYRLTHLLEKGHVIRNGTQRNFGRAPAYPHIAPINDEAQAELINYVTQRIKQ